MRNLGNGKEKKTYSKNTKKKILKWLKFPLLEYERNESFIN